jgi:Fe-S cluster assembly scaffold protein SufB
MSMTQSLQQKLTIYIGTSSAEPLSLRALLAGQVGKDTFNDVVVSIIIAPSVEITIEDDVHEVLSGERAQHEIECVLHRYSMLTYRCSILTQFTQTLHKNLNLRFIGQHSCAHMKCMWRGKGENTFAISTLQDHQVASCRSRVEVRSVLDDHAILSCTGLIKVAHNASGTIADQMSKNLMLSTTAHVRAIPQLEVENNDVQCRHGAAISTLSDDQLFYLQGRGLSLNDARQMLVNGFLSAHSGRSSESAA